MLVGITGYAQHGKDSLAAALVEDHGYTRRAFADALKQMALVLNPAIEPYECGDGRLADLVRVEGWEGAKLNPEVRRFLQVLGTEGVRNILGDQSWVSALEHWWMVSGAKNLVIPDVRFPNEAEWVKRHNGYLVRVKRKNADNTPFDNGIGLTHPSEHFIATLPVDANFTVMSGDMDAFKTIANSIAAFSRQAATRGPAGPPTREELEDLFR